jgi:hypothetical protein
MAETTITLADDDGTSSLTFPGVGTSGTTTTQTVLPAGTVDPAQAAEARIAELERLSGRHREQLTGWDRHSQALQAELNATRERLARLEGRSEVTSAHPKPDTPAYTPGKMKTALQKWLNNDDSELDELESVMGRSFNPPAGTQPALKPEDFKKLIREELVELGTRGNVQTIVGSRHPDLVDAKSQLTQAVWDEYDAYVANPENVVLYGKDTRYHVPMLGPDGQQRMVDARYVDRLAADIKLRGGIQEGRRQESRASQVGSAQTGSGRTTQTNIQRSVEAFDLLSDIERQLIQDPKVRKGWPKMPSDIKAASKYFFDGLPDAEKNKRVQAYRDRARGIR